jgi:hypothetical protein
MPDEFEQYRVVEPTGDEFEQYRVQDQEPENLSTSLKLAIPRIYEDAVKSLYGGIQSIPSYYEKSKTEAPAFLRKLSRAEFTPHNLMQGLAGVNEGVNALGQFPRALAGYGENRLHLLPEGSEKAVRNWGAPDTSEAINQLFGEPSEPGEAALRGMGRNILPISGIARLARIAPHLTKYGATRALKNAKQLAEKRNIGTIDVNPALIEDARQFLSNTLPNRNALTAAHEGDYNSLFRLQSDLGQNAYDYAKSLFSAAERQHGRAGLGTRNRLLDAIHSELNAKGHQDISELLRKGQNDYRKYMAFKPYRNILALAGLGAGGLSIPENPVAKLAHKFWSQNTQ